MTFKHMTMCNFNFLRNIRHLMDFFKGIQELEVKDKLHSKKIIQWKRKVYRYTFYKDIYILIN